MPTLTPRPVAASVDELLAGAVREAMDKTVDSLSGAGFERAVVDGRPCIVKYLGADVDWLARALGDEGPWALTVWQSGLLDALPGCIDHTVLGMSRDPATGVVAALMTDVGPFLVPSGDTLLPLEQHLRFLDHCARFHATFWDFRDDFGLLGPGIRYQALTPATGRREHLAGGIDPVPSVLEASWAALHAAEPALHDAALRLVTDPAPLVRALAETPMTFVHGDWKAGNLGSHLDGRTILLDWGWPGRTGPLVDIAWYLAVNCDRLPISKEDTIDAYRGSLESLGIETGPWWDRQLELALLGGFLQLGWSKSGAELAWWASRVLPTARAIGS